jgi:hypothetical protein
MKTAALAKLELVARLSAPEHTVAELRLVFRCLSALGEGQVMKLWAPGDVICGDYTTEDRCMMWWVFRHRNPASAVIVRDVLGCLTIVSIICCFEFMFGRLLLEVSRSLRHTDTSLVPSWHSAPPN